MYKSMFIVQREKTVDIHLISLLSIILSMNVFFLCDGYVYFVFSLFFYQSKNEDQSNIVVLCKFVCCSLVVL